MANWSATEANFLQDIARKAGACILDIRAKGISFERKPDQSKVTAADKAAQEVILRGLSELTPGVPVVSEEKDNPPELVAGGTYWMVDPLDGTNNYVKGRDEFTVNIGLVTEGQPILGVVYAPVMDDLFYGDPMGAVRINSKGASTIRQVSTVAANPNASLRLITGRREAESLPLKQWLESGQISAWRVCSSAYKFGLLSAGEHDIFICTGRTYEWDTAAGDAILRSVGGLTVTPDGKPLTYSKSNYENGLMIAYNRGASTSLFAIELGQRLQAMAA